MFIANHDSTLYDLASIGKTDSTAMVDKDFKRLVTESFKYTFGSLCYLPQELRLQVFSYLNFPELVRLSRSSKAVFDFCRPDFVPEAEEY